MDQNICFFIELLSVKDLSWILRILSLYLLQINANRKHFLIWLFCGSSNQNYLLIEFIIYLLLPVNSDIDKTIMLDSSCRILILYFILAVKGIKTLRHENFYFLFALVLFFYPWFYLLYSITIILEIFGMHYSFNLYIILRLCIKGVRIILLELNWKINNFFIYKGW